MTNPSEGAVGRNIRHYREAAGLSQAELAEKLGEAGIAGIYPQTITKIEGGSRTLKFAEGVVLADALGVQPGALIQESGEAAAANEAIQRLVRTMREYENALVSVWELADKMEGLRPELVNALRDAEAATAGLTDLSPTMEVVGNQARALIATRADQYLGKFYSIADGGTNGEHPEAP